MNKAQLLVTRPGSKSAIKQIVQKCLDGLDGLDGLWRRARIQFGRWPKLPFHQLMGVTTQIDNNKQSLAFPKNKTKVSRSPATGAWWQSWAWWAAAVTLNRGMLCPPSAVGGSSSLLGGPTFSLNISAAISTKILLNNYSSCSLLRIFSQEDLCLLECGHGSFIYLKQRKSF